MCGFQNGNDPGPNYGVVQPAPAPMSYVQPIQRNDRSSIMPRDRVGEGSGLGARNATQVAQLGGINRRTGAV